VSAAVYLFCKWLHLVAVISWMAGILYLYRILIYQAERGGKSQDNHELLTFMGERLYRIITRPAMAVAILAGGAMIAQNPGLLATGWLKIKLAAVVGLVVATVHAGRLVGRFAEKAPHLPSGRRLRLLNEVPTLIMMLIVAMAVFRPF
jgi:putative membrane protein